MIYSMTGFGRSQARSDWGMAIWEIRSINHRYLEINIRLPEIVRELEQSVRENIHLFLSVVKLNVVCVFIQGQNWDHSYQLIAIY